MEKDSPSYIFTNENPDFIEKSVINNVRKIILKTRKCYNTDYEDTTYREIYTLCQNFARDLSMRLFADNKNQDKKVFGHQQGYNYFNPNR